MATTSNNAKREKTRFHVALFLSRSTSIVFPDWRRTAEGGWHRADAGMGLGRGLIGTAMVLPTLHAVPRIGVATFVAAVVCGQLVAALAYDHIGVFGMELWRVALRDIAGGLSSCSLDW